MPGPFDIPQNPFTDPYTSSPTTEVVPNQLNPVSQALINALISPINAVKNLTQSHMQEYQPGMSVQDMPQTMQALPEVAMAATSIPGGSGGLGMGIRAYHGSPYDFERFDMSKIGTGEGAQAYGHGLYFAENPQVAQEYRDVLTRRPINDSEISPTVTANALFDIAEKNGGLISGKIPFGPSRGLLTRDQIVSGFEQGKFSPFDLPPAVQRQIVDHIKPPGKMYEVNINADPHQFLDWDKPLAEMGPEVQAALSGFSPHMTGAQINESARLVPGKYRDNRVATENLSGMGIPGIKYLDQGSRGMGAGTSNYVLFNDKIIDILKKYGIAAGPFGAGLEALQQKMNNEQ